MAYLVRILELKSEIPVGKRDSNCIPQPGADYDLSFPTGMRHFKVEKTVYMGRAEHPDGGSASKPISPYFFGSSIEAVVFLREK